MLKYIVDTAHYTEVLARVPKVKRSLWVKADTYMLQNKIFSQLRLTLAQL